MARRNAQKQLYVIFWIIIIVLMLLIGWFTFLLIKPNEPPNESIESTNTKEQTTTNKQTQGKKKQKNNKNSNAAASVETTETSATNESTSADGAENEAADSSAGLVEPEPEDSPTTAEESSATPEDDDGKQTITLYFPKSNSACGEVYPVERKIEPTDDLYGQIILENMSGPTEDEGDYTTAIPSDLGLHRVEYTADGAVITVDEAYTSVDECDQKTIDAQLIETANAMFELPEGTAGDVVVI